MYKRTFTICLLLLLISAPTQATLLHVDAQATYIGIGETLNVNRANVLLPLPSTTVTASIDFDIGPGDFWDAVLSAASGTFSWTHSTAGSQVYTVTGVHIGSGNADGHVSFSFPGTGPTIVGDISGGGGDFHGVTAWGFSLYFNVFPINPLTPGYELSELILGSHVDQFGMSAKLADSQDGALFVYFSDNVTSTISLVPQVPEPTTMLLLGLGLIGIAGMRRKMHK